LKSSHSTEDGFSSTRQDRQQDTTLLIVNVCDRVRRVPRRAHDRENTGYSRGFHDPRYVYVNVRVHECAHGYGLDSRARAHDHESVCARVRVLLPLRHSPLAPRSRGLL